MITKFSWLLIGSISINTILISTSLFSQEVESGKQATSTPSDKHEGGYLLMAPLGSTDVHVELELAPSADDVLAAIRRAKERAVATGRVPWLQVDSHGLSDGGGLYLADGGTLLWGPLLKALSELNEVTTNGVGVILSACHGGKIVQGTLARRRATSASRLRRTRRLAAAAINTESAASSRPTPIVSRRP